MYKDELSWEIYTTGKKDIARGNPVGLWEKEGFSNWRVGYWILGMCGWEGL